MLKFESRLVQVRQACVPAEFPENKEKMLEIQSFQKFLQKLRLLSGLAKEAVFYNLRVPDQFQKSKEEINVVVLTGQGVFCLDLRNWRGKVSMQDDFWLLESPESSEMIKNTSVKQFADPVQRIKTKTSNLWNHLMKNGVCLRQTVFFPRVVFLNPSSELDPELLQINEVIAPCNVESFLCSFKEGYMKWIADIITPHWLSGHLSFRHICDLKEVLGRIGTWDLLDLNGGQRLIGDYLGCQHIALNREEADELEFSHHRNLSAGYLWALLGFSPQHWRSISWAEQRRSQYKYNICEKRYLRTFR
ncbi:uncharacterized protein si:zfos-911d5.4 isoform X2 [Callorhinchus milii]|uniref:uncharacterized protein si:zfos-911d5.4 isoform X2 n=1 Tax=Callorhinchus milii TaxID=7868 RepID=UPI0004571DEF|nr:uncharacterized protein si:zfos-911d5.4 isoform X2 [Callorhinchus milii]|eukprot:gi/632971348/ref/XP_007902127.1/ PREDICTED: uncharacterized protein LOC103185440 isoform X2 [Callorhinchus milii]